MHFPTLSSLFSLLLGLVLVGFIIKIDLEKKPRELKEALWDYFYLIALMIYFTIEAFGISWLLAAPLCIFLVYKKAEVRTFIEKYIK